VTESARAPKPTKADPPWKQLELLVAQIQKELAPDAEVQHNVKLKGRDSEQMRQVDVLVRQSIGQYVMMIAIDCKDHAEPVDVKGLEEFYGLLQDIGAHKGAMVAPKGFTPAAKKVAARHQIDLYSPVDTDPHKWQAKPSLPTLCDYRGAAIAFGISVSAPMPFRLAGDFWDSSEVYDENGTLLGTPFASAIERWNNGEYPTEPGEHEDVPLFPAATTLVDNGYGTRLPVTLTVSLMVKQTLYFGYLPIVKIRGLRDEHTGGIVTNAFTTGSLDHVEVEEKWQPVASETETPVRPALRFVGLECWSVTA